MAGVMTRISPYVDDGSMIFNRAEELRGSREEAPGSYTDIPLHPLHPRLYDDHSFQHYPPLLNVSCNPPPFLIFDSNFVFKPCLELEDHRD